MEVILIATSTTTMPPKQTKDAKTRAKSSGKSNRASVAIAEPIINPASTNDEEPPSSSSPSSDDDVQVQVQVQETAPSKKRPRAEPKGTGKTYKWQLPSETEENLIEWLKEHPYLWLRSNKDYLKKKASWEEKARQLDLSVNHLQNWWKNLKDTYVRLKKTKSGQAARVHKGRAEWVISSLQFYTCKYVSLYVFEKHFLVIFLL